MRSITYGKYTGEDWDSLSIQELLNKLSDFLLQSGFTNPYFDDLRNSDRDLQSLHDAIHPQRATSQRNAARGDATSAG
jgi:Ca-activated chloride channel homolog